MPSTRTSGQSLGQGGLDPVEGGLGHVEHGAGPEALRGPRRSGRGRQQPEPTDIQSTGTSVPSEIAQDRTLSGPGPDGSSA